MRGRQQQRVRGGERQAMSPRRAAWVDTPSTERRPKAGGLAAQGWTPATWDHRTPPSTPSTCHITCVDPSGGHRCIDTHRIRSLAEACTHKDKRHPPPLQTPHWDRPVRERIERTSVDLAIRSNSPVDNRAGRRPSPMHASATYNIHHGPRICFLHVKSL